MIFFFRSSMFYNLSSDEIKDFYFEAIALYKTCAEPIARKVAGEQKTDMELLK